MRRSVMRLVLALCMLLIAAGLAFGGPKYPEMIEKLRDNILSGMERGGVTATSIAVMEDGRIVYSEAFGWQDKASNVKPTLETLFNFGSFGKVVCAASVMKLVDQGRLDLDAPVVKYLPDFRMADPRYRNITVRMLLDHSSGLPGSYKNGWIEGVPDNRSYQEGFLKALENSRLSHEPGLYDVYCNDGFTLAEILISMVSGKSYEDFVRQEFFEPLGMKRARYSSSLYEDGSWVKIPGMDGGAWPQEVVNTFGAGGLSAPPEEICRFLDLFVRDGVTASGVRILSTRAVALMTRNWGKEKALRPKGPSWSGHGLEWESVEEPWFASLGLKAMEKGGGTAQYVSSTITIPEKKLVVAISSAGGWLRGYPLSVKALTWLLEEKGDLREEDFGPHVALAPVAGKVPREMKDFAGIYGANGMHGKSYRKSFTGDYMKLEARRGARWALVSDKLSYRENGRFAAGEDPLGGEWFFQVDPVFGVYLANSYLDGYKGYVRMEDLMGQMIPESFPVSSEARSAWEKRQGLWLLAGDAWSSFTSTIEGYALAPRLDVLPETPGMVWFSGSPRRIVDGKRADTFVQLPIWYGRDMTDIVIFDRGGEEWIRDYGLEFRPASGIATLVPGDVLMVTIKDDGYSEWFFIPEDPGQSLWVVKGDMARWLVYDPDTMVVADSLQGSRSGVSAPPGGLLQLAGEPGAEFAVYLGSKPVKP